MIIDANEVQHAYEELYEYCEKIAKKNKSLIMESKKFFNELASSKDQLKEEENVIKCLKTKLINSEKGLSNAENEIKETNLKIESNEQELKTFSREFKRKECC